MHCLIESMHYALSDPFDPSVVLVHVIDKAESVEAPWSEEEHPAGSVGSGGGVGLALSEGRAREMGCGCTDRGSTSLTSRSFR